MSIDDKFFRKLKWNRISFYITILSICFERQQLMSCNPIHTTIICTKVFDEKMVQTLA